MVAGDYAPAVFFSAVFDVTLADVNHGFYGEHHAGF